MQAAPPDAPSPPSGSGGRWSPPTPAAPRGALGLPPRPRWRARRHSADRQPAVGHHSERRPASSPFSATHSSTESRTASQLIDAPRAKFQDTPSSPAPRSRRRLVKPRPKSTATRPATCAPPSVKGAGMSALGPKRPRSAAQRHCREEVAAVPGEDQLRGGALRHGHCSSKRHGASRASSTHQVCAGRGGPPLGGSGAALSAGERSPHRRGPIPSRSRSSSRRLRRRQGTRGRATAPPTQGGRGASSSSSRPSRRPSANRPNSFRGGAGRRVLPAAANLLATGHACGVLLRVLPSINAILVVHLVRRPAPPSRPAFGRPAEGKRGGARASWAAAPSPQARRSPSLSTQAAARLCTSALAALPPKPRLTGRAGGSNPRGAIIHAADERQRRLAPSQAAASGRVISSSQRYIYT